MVLFDRRSGSPTEGVAWSHDIGQSNDEAVYVPGQAQDSGQSGQPTGTGQGTPSDLVPYNSVLSQYRDQAMSQVDRADIPDQERQLVQQYFSDLGQ